MSMMTDGVRDFVKTVIDPEIAGREILYRPSGGRPTRIMATASQEERERDQTRGIAVIRYTRQVIISTDRKDGIAKPLVNRDNVEIDCKCYNVIEVKPAGDGYAFLTCTREALQDGRASPRGFE